MLGEQRGLQGSNAFDAFELTLFQMEFHILSIEQYKIQAAVRNPHIDKRSHVGIFRQMCEVMIKTRKSMLKISSQANILKIHFRYKQCWTLARRCISMKKTSFKWNYTGTFYPGVKQRERIVFTRPFGWHKECPIHGNTQGQFGQASEQPGLKAVLLSCKVKRCAKMDHESLKLTIRHLYNPDGKAGQIRPDNFPCKGDYNSDVCLPQGIYLSGEEDDALGNWTTERERERRNQLLQLPLKESSANTGAKFVRKKTTRSRE
ncbi:hypothetical protein WISP_48137 [Willisornis vidua]|uniref:Uncharacterized protein n=1 Tax=Willisornis vidua TaxID=1566151 RepID=A0ABQ9DG48_9PASS|nr:hypothetical protein WISP_48137 [Willisornis vidua]